MAVAPRRDRDRDRHRRRPPASAILSPMNIATLLRDIARRLPDRPAVSDREAAWPYRQFHDRVARTAAWLRSRPGVAPGDRVGIAMENSAACLQMMFATWHAGLCAVPMNAKLHPREFAWILDDAGARLALASPSLYSGIRDALHDAGKTLLFEVDARHADAMAAATAMPVAERAHDDPAWLFYTSGTTGRPKGATLSHRNLMFMAHAYYADIDRLGPHDTLLHAAPLSHGSGLYAIAHVARGSHNRVLEHFAAAAMFDEIERLPNVSFFAAPTMLVRMLNDPACGQADLRNLKTIIYGGAPMYVADLHRAIERFDARLYQLYGQGESPMTITGLDAAQHADRAHPRHEARLASVGYPRTGVEVRVVDDDDRDLPPGEVGEIITRSDCRMLGYWRNDAANAGALRNGWLHTGDVGSLDDDGLLTLKDRSKDLIISGGSNIYPREVEEVLLQVPGVAQASVVGAPHPDWGEEVVAFIVRQPGAALVSEAALEAACLAEIARFKRPKRYVFVDDLPKNNYGKVLKTELRAKLAAQR